MVIRSCKMINKEGSNTPTTANLQEKNERSLLNTIRKKVVEAFKTEETKMSEMISKNLQNTNDRLDEISDKMTEITKSLEFTQDQFEE